MGAFWQTTRLPTARLDGALTFRAASRGASQQLKGPVLRFLLFGECKYPRFKDSGPQNYTLNGCCYPMFKDSGSENYTLNGF